MVFGTMASQDLTKLDYFMAVARYRSFRGAAAVHGVSASTLSEAVRQLESGLGVRLLNRTTRSVTLTQAGARLVDRLLPALRQVNEALDVVNGPDDSPTGTLRLNVPSIVARLILPPLIPAFLKAHPRIALEVHAEDTFVDVLAAGFDAGIRYDERLEQDMIAVPIGPRVQRFAAAAAPSYLSEHGRPEHPKDLLDHACIRHRFPSGATASWEFERDGEIVRIDPPARIISTMIDLELDAAVSGLGIICSFQDYLAPSYASGALEPILDDWAQAFPGPFLYYSSRTYVPAPLRAFIDFLKASGGD
jgi:DNA-binding transcriptional LysR family regulator